MSQSPPLNRRPDPIDRKFNSTVIENVIRDFTARLKDPAIAAIFENCFPSTLDTTVNKFAIENGAPDTFIITGDIPAMWFRDSTNQVAPYLRYIQQDENIKLLIQGLINRHIDSVLHDPYANAYNENEEGGPWQGDRRTPPMTPRVFEGKYELDSLAAILKLANQYYKYSNGDHTCFTDKWLSGVEFIIATIRVQQKGADEEYSNPAYKFNRNTEVATDTLMMQGRGVPSKRCGLSKCYFRPSDDATTLPFLIPANAMAAVELAGISSLIQQISWKFSDPAAAQAIAADAQQLSEEIRQGIMDYAVVDHVKYGQIYAYEVDGFGSSYFMDDANIPGLLSLPYLGFTSKSDPLYLRTRSFVLSDSNPFYYSGTVGQGIGGPHIGFGYIWPMGLCIQGITSTSDDEIIEILDILKTTTANTNFMHESFWKDNAFLYTRSWFAWANSLFAEFILILANERPHLIF